MFCFKIKASIERIGRITSLFQHNTKLLNLYLYIYNLLGENYDSVTVYYLIIRKSDINKMARQNKVTFVISAVITNNDLMSTQINQKYW
jgi:hypothetical protein